nr:MULTISPECIES: hypothetical protein [unclassified Mesorhizobium]
MTEAKVPEGTPVDGADFRAAMRLIVGNVSVITAGTGGSLRPGGHFGRLAVGRTA